MTHTHLIFARKGFYLLAAVMCIAGLFLSPVQAVSPSTALADPPPGPEDAVLARCYKAASKPMLFLGEVMTYTIHIEIGWSASLYGTVTDPIPHGLEYVPGSASHGGTYDSAARTLTWTQVPVGNPAPVDLTFDVKDIATVNRPTPVVNTATIEFNGFIFQRQAWVTLMPEIPGQTGLEASFKSAWPRILGAGEMVTYTITLLNKGTAPVTVQVADEVPALLSYVAGSANHDGIYNPATRTVTWKDVVVPPYNPLLPVEPVRLKFNASAPNAFPVNSPRPLVVTNTAVISTSSFILKRSVDILLRPYPYSPLAGSYKTASHRSVFPGQEFSYFIYLNNSASFPVRAAVSDPLPVEVSYVEGSANANGVYDPSTRTVNWDGLTVLEGSTLMVTFKVIAGNSPAVSPRITNTADITSGNQTISRSVTILLQPDPGIDPIPPVVQRFTIDGQDVLTGTEVRLHIDARDNVGVQRMFLKEWLLMTDPFPHWKLVNSSGWIRYQADYPYKLSDQSGTHFLAVWVADAAGNRSKLTRSAIDFASLLQPDTQVGQGKMIPYLVYYPAGIDVKAELSTWSGAAHLFVWYPSNLFSADQLPPAGSQPLNPGSDIQTITFTTPTPGVYLFLVYGLFPSHFDLSITPGGGPRIPIPQLTSASPSTGMRSDDQPALESAVPDGLDFNPVLAQSGLDPMDAAEDPQGPYESFIPALSN